MAHTPQICCVRSPSTPAPAPRTRSLLCPLGGLTLNCIFKLTLCDSDLLRDEFMGKVKVGARTRTSVPRAKPHRVHAAPSHVRPILALPRAARCCAVHAGAAAGARGGATQAMGRLVSSARTHGHGREGGCVGEAAAAARTASPAHTWHGATCGLALKVCAGGPEPPDQRGGRGKTGGEAADVRSGRGGAPPPARVRNSHVAFVPHVAGPGAPNCRACVRLCHTCSALACVRCRCARPRRGTGG